MNRSRRSLSAAHLVWISFFVSSCPSCGEDEKPLTYLRDSHLFIAGVLAPDEDRSYHHEIFVGKLTPTGGYGAVPDFGQDTVLNRLMTVVHKQYFADFEGIEKAKVYVTDANGTKTEFLGRGGGFYRDEQGLLTVVALGKYEMEVQLDGKTYRAETRIPSDFEILDIAESDTVVVPKVYNPAILDSSHILRLKWTRSSGASFYRKDHLTPVLQDRWALDHSLDTNQMGVQYSFRYTGATYEPTRLRLLAIDSNFAKLYYPHDWFTYTDEWLNWLNSQWNAVPDGSELIQPDRKTNVVGEGEAVGIFGSYNQAAVNFMAKRER